MNLSLWLQSLLYIAAGINHFWHPYIYYRIIPRYIPAHSTVNIITGVAEIVLGALLLFHPTRKFAVYLIIAMLIAFIPAHIYLIQISRCKTGGFCWPLFAAWVRLIPGQLLLIMWAYSVKDV